MTVQRSLRAYVLAGSLSFCLTSLCVFATVAFAEGWMYRNLGLAGAYSAWTILFIGIGGAAMRPLVRAAMSAQRFYALFALAFFFYAIGWTTAYFILRGPAGEWLGSLLGSLLLGLIFAAGFGALRLAPRLGLVLFIANSLGYFLGAALNAGVGGPVGMLLWGFAYGLFLGAGLGAVLYFLSGKAKQ